MKITLAILFAFTISESLFAQYNGNDFAVGVYAVYTNTTSIFLNPNASDIVLRNQSFEIDDIFNPAIDLRYRVSDPLIIGLNIEYIKKTSVGPNLNAFVGSTVITIDVEDGFKVIPVELTAYYLLPFSTEKFKFLMGGGGAFYMGEFIRKVGDAEVTNVESEKSFGIQVMASMNYLPLENLIIRFQMKFRDPQITVSSKYNKSEAVYQGQIITLPQQPFDTKIDMDGITFLLGAAFQF